VVTRLTIDRAGRGHRPSVEAEDPIMDRAEVVRDEVDPARRAGDQPPNALVVEMTR
jgi:hypothetical protein